MAASTATFEVESTAFTALSAGHSSVMIHVGLEGPIKLAIATSLPSASSEDWFPVYPSDPRVGNEDGRPPNVVAFEGLAADENVYAQAMSPNSVTVRVLRA